MTQNDASADHIPSERSARRVALEAFSADRWDDGEAVDGWLRAIRKEREEKQRIKAEAQSAKRLRGLVHNGGFDQTALLMVERVERIRAHDPVRAVKVHTHYMVLAKLRGIDQDVEIPEEGDETPVFDRMGTAKRLKGLNPAREGARPTWGLTLHSAYQQEVAVTAERLYQKLVDGVPLNRLREGEGAGRPSKAWQEAYQIAYDRFERETDPSQQEATEQSH